MAYDRREELTGSQSGSEGVHSDVRDRADPAVGSDGVHLALYAPL